MVDTLDPVRAVPNGASNSQKQGAVVDFKTATSPCDLAAVPGLLKDIAALSAGVYTDNDNGRLELLQKARALVCALETPRETMVKHTWAENTNFAALAFGVDTGLWEQWVKNGDHPQKASDLASQLGIETALLARFLKHISAMGHLIETSPDEYVLSNFTKSLSLPMISGAYPSCLWSANTSLINLHNYLKETDYRDPTSPDDGNYQRSHNTKNDFFTHLQNHPPNGERFNAVMSGYRQGRPSWMDKGFFPVESILFNDFNPSSGDGALLVDIGGNTGHDIDEFRRKHPGHPGKLVLQDLERVINQIESLDESIVRMPYDFFTENPVKGAKAYYLHAILHDWPDEQCVRILKNISDAMKPDYSRLLINEQVIPSIGAHWETTALDILMMSTFSSRERTEGEWTNLVEKLADANLKIVKFWSVANGVEHLIEIEKTA